MAGANAADERLRVLWLINGLGPGGAERLLVAHAAAADGAGFQYEAAYLVPWKDHLVPELASLGVTARCLGTGSPLDLRWALRLRRLLEAGRHDVLHVHSPTPAAVSRLLARTLPAARRPAIVYTEHNHWPMYRKVTRLVNRVTYGLNDAVLAVSADARDSVSPRHRGRVEVVHHGIDVAAVRAQPADRAELRAELGVAPGEVLVATVANLRREKAYPDLLAAARQVLDAGLAVRFVAVGQGPLEAEIADLHARLGLGSHFTLLGYRSDVLRILGAADVFALASVHEGLPVAVMEALALGLPVVATAVGGLPEAVTDGVEGLLVPAGRPDLLAAALSRVVSDPDLRLRLSAAARRGAERFDAGRSTARVEAVYREVAAGRSVSREGESCVG